MTDPKTTEDALTATPRTYVCADCGGTFEYGRPDAEAHAEAVADFGRDGQAPGMEVVCDDCYQAMRAACLRSGGVWGDE